MARTAYHTRKRPSDLEPAFAILLSLLLAPGTALAQSQSCILLARADSLPGSGSSCWGYVDPTTGSEYAIYGNQFGTAIFNIDVPIAPRMTGLIGGPASNWREMKTYGSYCYVGTEGGGGLQIIDLADPEAPALAATFNAGGLLDRIHSVTIDSVTAKLYANGSRGSVAGNHMRILSLADPVAPTLIGDYTDAYVHDTFARNDTVWAACISVGQVRVLDAANPDSITQIVAFTTERNAPHNCWPTEDRQYLLVTDEVSGGRVTSWDISVLSTPIQVDGFTADPAGDAHNVHVRGNLAFVAHYTSGLQILDVSDPTNLTRVGYYDTFPQAGGGVGQGAWGLYCWFPSTTIVVSDVSGGMFLIDHVENPAYLRGVVTDANTSLPIPGAEVHVLGCGARDSTDALGAYLLFYYPGTHDVEATAFGHVSQATGQTLVAGDTADVNFALTPVPTGSLSGAFRYLPGEDIPNALVALRGTPLGDTTDAIGAYSFPMVPAGPIVVALDFWTSVPDSAAVTVGIGLASEVNFLFQGVVSAYDFEDTSTAGWAVNAGGGDNAISGGWTRVNPNGTSYGDPVQPEDDHSRDPLAKCWVTGQGVVGGSIGGADVDGGRTSLYSPIMDLSGVTDPTIQYYRWYVHEFFGTSGEDPWKVQISSDSGASWVTTDSTTVGASSWKEVRLRVADFVTPTSQTRVRFIAADTGSESIVEAAVDDFRVWGRPTAVAVGGENAWREGGAPRFALLPNTPNPFNPSTAIHFELPRRANAHLAIYSPEGRLVRTLVRGPLAAGPHGVAWDGKNDAGSAAASGIYVLRLDAGGDHASRKVNLIK